MTFFQLYFIAFLTTIIALLLIAIRSYKNIDIILWSMEIIMPLVLLGYLGISCATNIESSLLSNNLACLETTALPVLFFISMQRYFRIKTPTILKQIIYVLAFCNILLIWFGSFNELYYKDIELHIVKMGSYFTASNGPLMILHSIFLVLIAIGTIITLVYGYLHPERCTRKSVVKFTIIEVFALSGYLFEVIAKPQIHVVPFIYPVASWLIALSYEQSFSHNIDGIVQSMYSDGYPTGYFAFDMRKRFLGANETAVKLIPQLQTLRLDQKINGKYMELRLLLGQMMNALDEGNQKPRYVEQNGKVYQYKIKYFYIRKHGITGGYLFSINDDTDRQKNLNYIQNFNKTLKEDVRAQTSRIKDIQERVVLGLANTIENRDYSTGGHVKRTSDVVRILVNKMLEEHIGNLDNFYAERIIRAAPMHDLGKISIDNSILCKPGKLTTEEYAIMKTHPVKSGEIVNYILHGVEEQTFVEVAYNCARFHHERWDGTGYPDQLSGLDIPLEARIMAIADVYDALVSKRCYKEPLSFEQAAQVMIESMGSHFDPMMKEVFELSREELEAYYCEDSLL